MFRVVFGLIGGIIIARNAAPMAAPTFAAVIFAVAVGWFLCYRFGRRDLNMAVATAVATAVANAQAQADAKAQAIANSAVQIYMQSGQVPTPREMEIVAAYHDGEISNDDTHANLGAIEANTATEKAIA